MQPNNQKEHQMLVVAHVFGNAIFVTILGIPGKGVHVCNKLTTAQKSELLRLQLAADAK